MITRTILSLWNQGFPGLLGVLAFGKAIPGILIYLFILTIFVFWEKSHHQKINLNLS